MWIFYRQFYWFTKIFTHKFLQFTKNVTKIGEFVCENSIENECGLLPPYDRKNSDDDNDGCNNNFYDNDDKNYWKKHTIIVNFE